MSLDTKQTKMINSPSFGRPNYANLKITRSCRANRKIYPLAGDFFIFEKINRGGIPAGVRYELVLLSAKMFVN